MQINLFLAFPGILSHWLLKVDIGHPYWMVVGLPGNGEGVGATVTNGRGRLTKDIANSVLAMSSGSQRAILAVFLVNIKINPCRP